MTLSAELKALIKNNIQKLSQNGAEYVDVRYYTCDDLEELLLDDGNLETNRTVYESGIGVRVLWGGAWGFAATSDNNDIDNCFDLARNNAETASKLVNIRLDMGKLQAHCDSYRSPIEIDYFDVPLKEKLDFLRSIDNELNESWIAKRMIRAQFQRSSVYFFKSRIWCDS